MVSANALIAAASKPVFGFSSSRILSKTRSRFQSTSIGLKTVV